MKDNRKVMYLLVLIMISFRLVYSIFSYVFIRYIGMTNGAIEIRRVVSINSVIVLIINSMFLIVLIYIAIMEFNKGDTKYRKIISIINVGIYIISIIIPIVISIYIRSSINKMDIPLGYNSLGLFVQHISIVMTVVIGIIYIIIAIMTILNYKNIKTFSQRIRNDN